MFEIRVVHDLDEVAPVTCREDRERCILIGEIEDEQCTLGASSVSTRRPADQYPSLLAWARRPPYELEPACALPRGAACWAIVAAEAAFRWTSSRSLVNPPGLLRSHESQRQRTTLTRNIIALNEHGAVLHYTNLDRDRPDSVSIFPDRRRRAGPRLCIRHHANLRRRQSTVHRLCSNAWKHCKQDIVGSVRTGVDYRDVHLQHA